MFFLFHGDDTAKARSAAQKNIEAAKKKHSEAGYFNLNAGNFSTEKLDELVASQGLFYSAYIVFADHLCDDAENAEVFLKKIKEIKESPNFFVILEGKLNKKELEKLSKSAAKVEEFVKPVRKLNKKEELALKGEKIDFFEFANTLGERDKKKLWTIYQEALDGEVPSEEVHGMFFWQVKAMLAAIKSSNALEAGLNPYVYAKAKAYGKNYGEVKLKEMSEKLFCMYHEAHRGEINFAVSLERFILEI